MPLQSTGRGRTRNERGTTRKKFIRIPSATVCVKSAIFCGRCKARHAVVCTAGFPHSEISGSKVAWHLPGAYRRHTASFIAVLSLGIRHMLLNRHFLLGNLYIILSLFTDIYLLFSFQSACLWDLKNRFSKRQYERETFLAHRRLNIG